MGKAIDRIERDIADLEGETKAIAKELYSTYSSYLTALGQAMRQQLILASYHLSTHGYPESFLKLSYSQRQQLQKDLRNLATLAQQMLLSGLHSLQTKEAVDLPFSRESFTAHSESKSPESEADSSSEELKESEIPDEGDRSSLIPQTTLHVNNPIQLVQWQDSLESAIAKILQTTSYKANRLFQQAGVLPKKFPEPLLEAAARAEASEATQVAGPPNLLNLLIETDSSDESSASRLTQLLAIHLRLSEIEFADSGVMSGRNQIRKLSAKVSKLGREYEKKQRERAVAEAEAAWRASWFED